VKTIVSEQQKFPRFRVGARIEHIVLLVTFTILCLTGLPQKYVESDIGAWMVNLMGGIETVRIIHRWSAFFLIGGSFYHLFTAFYRLYVKRERMRILPDIKDAYDARDTVLHNIGVKDEPPKMRKFNFGEKFEYWAVVWGTGIMIVTGFMLLNPIATTSILPGQFIPAALSAHGWEAVLAASAIVIWHLYSVLVKQINPSMWTGKLPRKQMEEEHALELERIEAGGNPWRTVEPRQYKQRLRVYIIAGVVFGIAMLALTIWIFTFEETAITRLPPITPEVFVPLETPVP
jgi:cytochrome b subunit of formate dehydrogenase